MATVAILENGTLPLLALRLIEPKDRAKQERDELLRKEFDRLSKAIRDLIEPLVKAKDAADLDRLLQRQLRAYMAWKAEFFALILSSMSSQEREAFWEAYQRQNEKAAQSIRETAKDLSEEDVERLLYARTGVGLYSETLLRAVMERGLQGVDTEAVRATLDDFLKADLLLFVAGLILDRKLLHDAPSEEVKRVLTLLACKSEELIERVEDELMLRDPGVRERLERPLGRTLSLEECQKRLSSR
jgi:hypothetical protein